MHQEESKTSVKEPSTDKSIGKNSFKEQLEVHKSWTQVLSVVGTSFEEQLKPALQGLFKKVKVVSAQKEVVVKTARIPMHCRTTTQPTTPTTTVKELDSNSPATRKQEQEATPSGQEKETDDSRNRIRSRER